MKAGCRVGHVKQQDAGLRWRVVFPDIQPVRRTHAGQGSDHDPAIARVTIQPRRCSVGDP